MQIRDEFVTRTASFRACGARRPEGDAVVYVRADKKIAYGEVMEVLGLVGESGYGRVSLLSQPKPKAANGTGTTATDGGDMTLRSITWVVSLALHCGLLWFVLPTSTGAPTLGTGDDKFVVEQGITIEGVALMGRHRDRSSRRGRAARAQRGPPAIKEVKPEELIEQTEVIASENGPEQEMTVDEVKEVVEPQPPQVATIEQATQVAVEEKRAAGEARKGDAPRRLKAYGGKLHAHLRRRR